MNKKILIVSIALVLICGVFVKNQSAKAADYPSATCLNLNGIWSTEHYYTGETQWYKFSVPTTGQVDMRAMLYETSYAHFTVYNADLSEKMNYGYVCHDTAPATDTWVLALEAGDYYLKVDDFGQNNRYKLYMDFKSYNANDIYAVSFDSPQNYELGQTITGATTVTKEDDWYKVRISNNKVYVLTVKTYKVRQDYTIYNSDLSNKLLSGYVSSDNLPATESREVTLSQGTYFIKMVSNYGGKYEFSLTELTPYNCSHNYKEKKVNATYFAKGYNLHICEKCRKSYMDNYIAKKKIGQSTISIYSHSGKGKIYLQWSTVSDASGYQIRYCKSKAMKKGVNTKKIKGQKKSKSTLKKLSRKKKYYVQVRAYRESGTKIVYGKWSSKKSLKTK